MTDLLPVVGALGLLLLYSGLTSPGRDRSRARYAVQRLVEEAGIGLTAVQLMAVATAASLSAALLAAGLTGNAAFGLVAAIGAGWGPFALARSRRERRRRAFREAWPDAIATMIAGIRAGVSLPEICLSLAERGPDVLRPSFGAAASTYRSTGGFQASLATLRAELADPIADRATVALGLAHEVGGGDLVRLLRTLADFIREDLRIRKEIEARWSWTVTAARIAAAAPWIVLLLMSTRPEAVAAYSSPGGGAVVLAGAAATFIGYRAMLRAAQLPDDRRFGR